MSFDLKIVNGSFNFDSTGKLEYLVNESKLKQDIEKIVLTEQGSNALHTWYGSPLSERILGTVMPRNIIESEVNSAINSALNNLAKLQALQSRDGQILTPEEQISKVLNVNISRSTTDVRAYNIFIDVMTKKGSVTRNVIEVTV